MSSLRIAIAHQRREWSYLTRTPRVQRSPAQIAVLLRYGHENPDPNPLFWCIGDAVHRSSGVWPCAAQSRTLSANTGSVEFFARATPTDAHPEPVRLLSFYLLSKSLTDIRWEAEQMEAPAALEHFIDALDASPELKAWMKKNKTVELAGSSFIKLLTPDDIVGVPEFLDAYKALNGAAVLAEVPNVKMKDSDKAKNREKYQLELVKYHESMRRYVVANPDATQGLDAELNDKNPGARWTQLRLSQRQHIDHRARDLAQTRYFVAKIDSDLAGRGVFSNVPPGEYWISALDTPALAGDARLRWDVPVTIQSGVTAHIELSNLNALETADRLPE